MPGGSQAELPHLRRTCRPARRALRVASRPSLLISCTLSLPRAGHPAAPRRGIVQGKPSPLLSSFKLSYYTLLNLLRRAEGSGRSMEYVIQRSFQQFQFERTLPALQARPSSWVRVK